MSNTEFSIRLDGINLSEESKRALQNALKGVLLTELAKVDLNDGLRIEPIAPMANRALPWDNPVLGFLINTLTKVPLRRDTPDALTPFLSPSATLFPGFTHFQQLAEALSRGTDVSVFDDAPLLDVLEAVANRPDIRQVIISNTRLLTEALDNNSAATEMLGQIIGDMQGSFDPNERVAPLVVAAVIVLGALAGGILGAISRPRPQ